MDDDFICKHMNNVVRLELFSPNDDRVVGVLVCDMTYDRVSHFQGEYAVKQEVGNSQTGSKITVRSVPKNKVQMYKGPCKTKNLFSMIDPSI